MVVMIVIFWILDSATCQHLEGLMNPLINIFQMKNVWLQNPALVKDSNVTEY